MGVFRFERRARAAVLVASLAAGCGPGGAGGADAAAPSDAGPPAVQLGTGMTAFEPLADGGTIELVLGPQGGWHLDVTSRLANVDPEGVYVTYEVRDAATGATLSHPARFLLSARRVLRDGDAYVRVGDRAVLDIRAASDVVARAVVVAVTLEAHGGATARDARRVTVVDAR